MVKTDKNVPKIPQSGFFHHTSIHTFKSNAKGYPIDLVASPYRLPNIICVNWLFGMGVLLLNVVKGATCFKDLRTVIDQADNEITYDTYQEACKQRGMFDDDQWWERTLEAAFLSNLGINGTAYRKLFVQLLVHAEVQHKLGLWLKFREKLCAVFYE